VTYLLDTNAISEPFRPKPHRAFMTRFERERVRCVISVITWQELVSGLHRMQHSKRRQAMMRYLVLVKESFPRLAFDEGAAEWAGEEDARLLSKGLTVSCEDVQIAATAHTHDLTLVTADGAFRQFRELRIVNWMK
jgi:predicted nucleic acid-binding protein